jgi:hypothetical protein
MDNKALVEALRKAAEREPRLMSYPSKLNKTATLLYQAADMLEAEGWQPIETAPKDGTRVVFYESGKKVKMGEHIRPEDGWCVVGWKCTNGNFHRPTHWMPLPTPPNTGEK